MSRRDHDNMRQRLAQVAARIIMESGIRDFHAAKQKAAQQLGANDTKSLPSNREIETALNEYQRLFKPAEQGKRLSNLRSIAHEAMSFLEPFSPKLVGSVLNGSVDQHSEISLHVFADTVESVGFYLMDKNIPYHLTQKRVRSGVDQFQEVSVYEFYVDETRLEIMVFLPRQKFTPISPVTGKPVQRADISQLQELMFLEEAEVS